jgi:hypothetical protein
MAIALLAVACTPAAESGSPAPGRGDSIAGTYNCGPPHDPSRDLVELGEDGTVTINEEVAGTWSVEGERGAITIDGQDDPFTIEGEGFVFDDGFVCAPAS